MPSVQILLAVYQGERFLEEQLRSLADQTVDAIHILVSDDGSTDRSMEILQAAKQTWKKGEFEIIHGPREGFAANFRTLLQCSKIDADYYAFCDQDDLWDSDKLEKSLQWHAGIDPAIPAVYGSRSRTVDEAGKLIDYTPLMKRPPGFQNAITQNLTTGHTMLLNKAARDLVVQTAQHIGCISHDYWTYLIVTGVGGVFHYCPTPRVSYRQHQTNLIGYRRSWRRHVWRWDRIISGAVKRNSRDRIVALEECEGLLTPDARSTLQQYKILHNASTVSERRRALAKSGIYRQSRLGRTALKVDCFFGLL